MTKRIRAVVGVLLLGLALVRSFAPTTSLARCLSNGITSDSARLHLVPPELADSSLVFTAVATVPSSLTWISNAVVVEDDAATTGLLSNQAIVATFVIGLVPFAVATVEFWRRIAVGDSFGTGSDSVVIIGEDDAPASSRGRRVLGKGAPRDGVYLVCRGGSRLGNCLVRRRDVARQYGNKLAVVGTNAINQ